MFFSQLVITNHNLDATLHVVTVATARPATANPKTKVDAGLWVIGTLDW